VQISFCRHIRLAECPHAARCTDLPFPADQCYEIGYQELVRFQHSGGPVDSICRDLHADHSVRS